jgi:V/A-type H+-transporting ATPase subunit D
MIRRSFAELMLTRKDEELAERGADVLEKMEHALTQDLIALRQKIDALQSGCSSLMSDMDRDLANATERSVLVDIEALVASEPLNNQVKEGVRKKFGKLVFAFDPPAQKETTPAWGASSDYEHARRSSRELIEKMVELGNAQSEEGFDEAELSKTRRRVNALRKIILPDLQAKKKALDEWLEEENREELGRRRWVEEVALA